MTAKKHEQAKNKNESIENNTDVDSSEASIQGNNEVLIDAVKEETDKLETLSKEELIKIIKDQDQELDLKNKELQVTKDWKEKYMHLQAEFENAQKRWNKDRNSMRIEYIASVLKKFLPLYDSYKKALEQDPENGSITQFYNQFMNILQSHDGAKVMNVKCNDPFDYHYHEALSSIERDDIPNNTIIDIIQDGWMIGKDVLRYAKVITSRLPKPQEPEPKIENQNDAESDKVVEVEENQNTE